MLNHLELRYGTQAYHLIQI